MPHNAPKSAGDVMLVVKRWLADDRPVQILCVAPATRRVDGQPQGIAPRRPLADQTRKNLLSQVPALLEQRFISPEAGEYLVRYANRKLVLPRRPVRYPCLDHRWNRSHGLHNTINTPVVSYDEERNMRGVTVSLRDVNGCVNPVLAIEDGIDGTEVEVHTALS